MFIKTKTLGFASLSFDKFAPLYSSYWYNIPFRGENQLIFDNNFCISTCSQLSPYQITVGVLFVVVIISSILQPMLTKKYLRKQFRTNKLLQLETEYIISENGIQRKSLSFDTTYKWNDIYKIIEKENMIIIYESSNNVSILPKRFFNNDKELVSVKELIKEKMNADKYVMLNNK